MYDKIVVEDETKKDAGSWVYTDQGVASEQGFNHVSRYWYPQTISFDEGMELLESEVAEREDLMLAANAIDVDVSENGVVFKIGDREFTPTEHALRQFGTWAYVPHTFINTMLNPVVKPNGQVRFERDQMDNNVFADVLKNGLRRIESDKVFRFRTYKDGTLRAMLSELYAPVDNRWYLQVLKENIPGGRLSHFDRSTADTIYGNVLIPDTIREEDDSDYGGMVSLSNCEIGTRRLGQMPSLFRAICKNGCIWGETAGKKYSFVHKSKDIQAKLAQIRDNLTKNIQEQIPIMQSALTQFLETKALDTQGVNMVNCIAKVALDFRMTPSDASQIFDQWNTHEKSYKNLFGLVNAVTRAAQEYDSEKWVKFDQIGGELAQLTKDQWGKFVKSASGLDVKDLDKAFGRKSDD